MPQTIQPGQRWVKQTEQWHGDLPAGTSIYVADYKDGWVWYRENKWFWSTKYILNELSFRRIFAPTC